MHSVFFSGEEKEPVSLFFEYRRAHVLFMHITIGLSGVAEQRPVEARSAGTYLNVLLNEAATRQGKALIYN